MKRPQAEAVRWLAQAASDLAFAEVGLREGFHAQTCFVCQQAAEKALKARQAEEAVALARQFVALARARLS